MARRGNHEGSIFKRSDGRWVASVTTSNGSRKLFYGKTRTEVSTKLTAALKQVQDHVPLAPERETVQHFVETWLLTKHLTLRPESYRRYEEICRIHIIPELGRIRLARLAPTDLDAAYAHRAAAGYSGTTIRMIHGVLHAALRQAMRYGLVSRNVAELVDTPKRSTRPAHALSLSELQAFLEAVRTDRLEALYVLAVTTGLRLGELQALQWRDVDLDSGLLLVQATLQPSPAAAPVFSDPKTAHSRRTVGLPQLAVDALRRWRTRQLEERLQAPVWDDINLVFTNERGRPLDGNNLRRRSLAPLLERAGLPPMRFHDLRHTAATLLMREGVPSKIVSERLGHADVATTLRIYSHVQPEMHRVAVDALDRLLGDGQPAPVAVKIAVKPE